MGRSGQQLLDTVFLVPFCAAMEERWGSLPSLLTFHVAGCGAGFSVSSLVQFDLNGSRGMSDAPKP